MSAKYRISNCFDSHVHWAGTGQTQQKLSLATLTSPEDVSQLSVNSKYFRGDWLIGFGWNHNIWPQKSLPTRESLDKIFPNNPVAFFRCDGHALWVNTKALEISGILTSSAPDPEGGKIIRDDQGKPTGVLVDMAMEKIEKLIPKPTRTQIREALVLGMQTFNKNGITHIRDMTCDLDQWQEKVKLDRELTLAVEQYFSAENPKNYQQALKLAVEAQKEILKNIRVKGVKIYFDGALGSEGALISGNYKSCRHNGLQLIDRNLLQEIMLDVWSAGLELAVHVIGDEACDSVMKVACSAWQIRDQGVLHLEHAEMVRPETIGLMKGKRVICHMQPCHYLSDRSFLSQKLGEQSKFLFPWALLEKTGVKINFGSDSPIEPPLISRNFLALSEAQLAGIPNIASDPKKYHSHADDRWAPDTWSEFNGDVVSAVTFRGKNLI